MLARWAWLVATAGGIGTVPVAPGTAGSAVGLAVGVLASRLLSPPWYLVTLMGLFLLGVVTAQRVERTAGRRDPPYVVIDEVVGMMVALLALPLRGGVLISVFICFRALDIAKPFPIRLLERQPGGWGMMLDDVAAGCFANLLIRGGLWALGGS